MYLRISLAMPPVWEIALSIVLMLVTIYALLWVASRIYRVGILMYGKKPNLPEILRWLKYS
jgi:ABC-2 type transport system permease protein